MRLVLCAFRQTAADAGHLLDHGPGELMAPCEVSFTSGREFGKAVVVADLWVRGSRRVVELAFVLGRSSVLG